MKEGETRYFSEIVKDVPEFVKIHVIIFGDKNTKNKDLASFKLTGPNGKVLINESKPLGFVVLFNAQAKGEYKMEIKNLVIYNI